MIQSWAITTVILLALASLARGADGPPPPPGFKPAPVLVAPKLLASTSDARMAAAVAPVPPSPVELRILGWKTFAQGSAVYPDLAIFFRYPSEAATIFYSLDGAKWFCWTTERNLRAGEVRRVGICPSPSHAHLLVKIIRHD